MKTEDFERLKKLCDENGFEITNMNNSLDGHELGAIVFAYKKKKVAVTLDNHEKFEFLKFKTLRTTFSIYNSEKIDYSQVSEFLSEQL